MAKQIGTVGENFVDLFAGPKRDCEDRTMVQITGPKGFVQLTYVELLNLTALVLSEKAKE